LAHGHSTPLVFDENYQLLGFVHLTDLLKNMKHPWEKSVAARDADQPLPLVKDLVVPFAGVVRSGDSILKALEIMMEHTVSIVPVMKEGKLAGIIKLSDIFNTSRPCCSTNQTRNKDAGFSEIIMCDIS
jgi:CBS-domain-containing membrane protein